MGFEVIFLILAVLVVAFGIGVIVVSRRNAASDGQPPAAPPRPAVPPPQVDTLVEPEAVTELDSELVDEALVEEAPVEEVAPPAPLSLRDRLAKARATFAGAFSGVMGRSGVGEESFEDLEEALLRADVGVGVTTELLDGLRAKVEAKEITEPAQLLDALQSEMSGRLDGADRALHYVPADDGPNVWMFVGVNGVGKTTTIGKLANQQVGDGRSVLMAAGDTFRAAAAEQLTTWAERSGADIVRGSEGGDPSSVVFDAVERATARDIDLVLADTAGRLHTKTNLMEELRKVRRVAEKGTGSVTETLLVIDATTGQNGLTQAREFGEATDVTGVVLTKLDGSAKGGIVFAVETELGIPVKLVGVGETIDDLIEFHPDEFVAALFER
ncbi:MAG: signal recognition particle-docking protein FtsY [Ilumatobacteraceae bacterium]|nr:signal recognition particle-docking protein FtsY [Ilumatobacteraceae bacterium]